MNTDLHPVTAALVDALRYPWGAADRSQTNFSSWLHVSIEANALSSALISLSSHGLIGVDLLSEEYDDIQDDLLFLHGIAIERARGGAA